MAKIIGRKEELAVLQSIQDDDKSAFVAVYGRRRVGKTFLIRSFYEGQFTFHLTGIANVETANQLTNFHSALIRDFPEFEDSLPAKDWFQAFQQLIKAIESLPSSEKKANRRSVLFLDELPWLDTPNALFISALEHFWNSWASGRTDIVLIVCGSAASWMINQLINNTGGLYNRVTHPIQLEPFTLAECKAFFEAKSPSVDHYQLLQLYMVFGGIPFYLDFIDPRKSATQNINDLCFKPKGKLRNEFDKLYASLFKKADKHIAVIEALAKKGMGLERDALLKAAKLPNGGNTTTVLRELEESNFIRKYNTFGKSKNNAIYQLADFYSLFYLKFIKNNSPFDDNYWINGIDTPEIRAWSGYAFEQVCLMHLSQIKNALGIGSVQTQTSAWVGSNGTDKAQIDLVIDRRDQVINLCEMKFSIKSFTIEKEYAENLRKKMSVFKDVTKTNKALWLTFITTHGLTQNTHAQSLVHQSLTMDALFY
ncbi:MAG: ATP-binding protein [Cytophagia bacterium]|nr:MAG: ATP-binding protein [Runella sp.]TAG37904.1 MAG: ATP-binding protein [Cytophagia bacterium]